MVMKCVLAIFMIVFCVGCKKQAFVENYENGHVRTMYEFYRDHNGRVVRDGYYRSYYEDGLPKHEATYLDGKKEGKWIEYHRSGHIKFEAVYVAGRKEGTCTYYDEDGEILVEETYKADVPHGRFVFFGSDGSAQNMVVFQDGKLIYK